MINSLDEKQLLEAVSRAGETVSPHQLKRWRRGGLIPRPVVSHAPGVRGSSATYPSSTVEQLLAVARLHRSVRNLDDLVVALWWEGRWVKSEALRNALIGPLDQLASEAREVRGHERDPYEAADQAMLTMKASGEPCATTALMRRRLPASADFRDLLWTFLVLGFGGEPPWEQEDMSIPDAAPGALELLARAFGVDRGCALNNGATWLPEDFDLPELMAQLRDAGGFDFEDPARIIREATDDQLAQAREDALLLTGPLALIGSTLEDVLGSQVAILGSLDALEPITTSARAAMIRSILFLRGLAGDDAFLAIRNLVADAYARYFAIAELRAALPTYGDILRVDYLDRLAALPPDEAAAVRDDVAGFFEQHPHHAGALIGVGDKPG
jgi:hypothetical protein